MMEVMFEAGRDNLALTIMVPYDCKNHCKFCTSKSAYAKTPGSLKDVIASIQSFYRNNKTLFVPEVVITGGEPMANIDALRQILSAIPKDKVIYINTCLLQANFAEFAELVNTHPQIKGVNVSRHFETIEEDRCMLGDIVPDDQIWKIKKPVRINCVVTSQDHNFLWKVMRRWEFIPVELSFREDYNEMDLKELHNPYSHHLPYVSSVCDYVGHTGCQVCDTTTFRTYAGLIVRYHKGLAKTLIRHERTIEINDIIIRQDGQVFADWKFTDENRLQTELLRLNSFQRNAICYSRGCGGSGC